MRTSSGRRSASRPASLAAVFGAGGAAFALGLLILLEPQIALDAALRGVAVWWDVLFPALFPFFVLSELLLGFGIVHLAGTLLDPYMRPLFRLPGTGGFIVAMGFVSGYPVGARLTSRLMEQGQLNRSEGERLVAMTTTSDPIFLIGAVCIGFFGNPLAAPALAAAHYGAALLLGLLLRFRPETGDRRQAAPGSESGSGRSGDSVPSRVGGAELRGSTLRTDSRPIRQETAPLRSGDSDLSRVGGAKRGRLRAALAAMHRARIADGRPFGLLLQQSLESSLRLIVIVGGLVVFFSAAMELLLHSGLLSAARLAIADLLRLAGLHAQLAPAVVNGFFEVTLGARTVGADRSAAVPLVDRIAIAAFILSWAGLSVHAQVAGLMGRTAWRYGPFARFRLLHALVAGALVYLVWPWLGPTADSAAIATAGLSRSAGSFFPLLACVVLLLPAALGLLAVFVLIGALCRAFTSRRD